MSEEKLSFGEILINLAEEKGLEMPMSLRQKYKKRRFKMRKRLANALEALTLIPAEIDRRYFITMGEVFDAIGADMQRRQELLAPETLRAGMAMLHGVATLVRAQAIKNTGATMLLTYTRDYTKSFEARASA